MVDESSCFPDATAPIVDAGDELGDEPEASPAPQSGFVGTWVLGSGTSSGGCQTPPFTGIALDPAVAAITQVSSTMLNISVFPPDFSYAQCVDQPLTLSATGTTASTPPASGVDYGCFGWTGTISLTLSVNTISMVYTADVSNPSCIETFNYTLDREVPVGDGG
jgi:hypothetical protein